MENDEGKTTGESEPVLHTQQPCRFFSQGRRCNFGKKCKFLHIRDDAKAHEKKTTRTHSQSDVPPPNSELPAEDVGHGPPPSNSRVTPAASRRRPCRYFISGHCSMEDRCRYWHPPDFTPVDHQPVPVNYPKPAQRMQSDPRSGILQEVKLRDLTEEVAKQLRDTEIQQLKKRFPKEQLIIQERSDGKVTYYRVTVEATDPDWPFDLKEVDIMVSFPDGYPQEIFTLDIPLDQELPPVMAKHVQQASLEWLQAKHATNQLLGKVELLFRPFLRWLDRSLERLFTEGARQLKKDVDLEKAGLQFISYQELQATVCEKSGNDHSSDSAAAADEDVSDEEELDKTEGKRRMEGGALVQQEGPDCDEGEEEEEEDEASHLVENIKIRDPRRGTEMKLLGLRMGDNTATCTAQCDKCSASITAAFRPCMLHHYNDVLGYLDLHNAAPADLVLQDCELIVGCLSCSQEGPVQNLSYGQTKEVNCEHCHAKLSILAESTRFQYIPPRVNKTGPNAGAVYYKMIRDPAVQKGKPLPEKGGCKHYKQSHRWLRYRHLWPFTNGKPCVSCGSMMTRGARSSHWEGGLGCRNKIKMSRNDRHKYANTNKTISRKAVADKK
ncbi:putative protein C18H10.09 [Liparis tanakae]|uniref:Nucleoporin NUP42 n=1 Tax=Liparis tanakae TaxID=230148 RepID=A0A4Z2GUJ8_9TELE|nr:putative protein C18H10.09 [Liparis tanakae]